MRNVLLFSLALLGSAPLLAQQATAPDPVISPDIGKDHTVTFRLAAPEAKQVLLQSGGDIPQIPPRSPMPMSRNAKGVWELALPLPPGAFRYSFVVDGVRVLDPGIRLTSESNDNAWSWFHVDGTAWMDANKVPHGALGEVTYDSKVSGKSRRLHVYTPPGFGKDNARYPVLYLLHGAFDSDDSWGTVGRAGFILDNLIASGAAKPMIVVMPHGHTGPTRPPAGSPPLPNFVDEFERDIKPFIESRYPLLGGRANTAIAGLSMGGGHTLDIGFNTLADYAYIGVFSSGVFSVTSGNEWETRHLAALDDKALKNGLKQVWFATGTEDSLIPTSRATVDLLKKHGFTVTYNETGGGHTWINWREYLHTFVPLLFK